VVPGVEGVSDFFVCRKKVMGLLCGSGKALLVGSFAGSCMGFGVKWDLTDISWARFFWFFVVGSSLRIASFLLLFCFFFALLCGALLCWKWAAFLSFRYCEIP
jgi:hypothetical protein